MNQLELDAFLEDVHDKSGWLHHGAFAGYSPAILAFVEELDRLAAAISEPESSKVVLFNRSSECPRVDNAVVRQLGFPAEVAIQLHKGCNEYNHDVLFGNGSKPGIFERGASSVVLNGIHHLCKSGLSRLVRHHAAWLAKFPHKVLLIGRDLASIPGLSEEIGQFASDLRYPEVSARVDDLVYELHLAAKSCNGGLETFSLEAVQCLLQHAWPGNIGEMDSFFRRVFREISFGAEPTDEVVRQCLEHRPKHRSHSFADTDPQQRWRDLVISREQIDQTTTSLIGSPFFAQRAETSAQRPLGSGCSQLDFLRLVSWGYMILVECGGPNISSFERIADLLQVRTDRVTTAKESIGRLRTFLQHSLQYESKSDQQTIEMAGRWFDSVVGRVSPKSHDYEICIATMLAELSSAFDDIRLFLDRLNDDEYKETIIRQWKDRIETAWPKHEHDKIIATAVTDLECNLDPLAISKKLLPKMQERLKVISRDCDVRAAMIGFTKELIARTFDLEKKNG